MITDTPDGVEWTPYAGPGRLFIGDQRVTDTATVDGVDYARTADGATFTRTGRGTDYEPADVPAPVTYSVCYADHTATDGRGWFYVMSCEGDR